MWSHARTPSTPTALPITSEAAISSACTQKKAVGRPSTNERSSFQIASANRGHITQVHTPTTVRKIAHRRVMTMRQLSQRAPTSSGTASPATEACRFTTPRPPIKTKIKPRIAYAESTVPANHAPFPPK